MKILQIFHKTNNEVILIDLMNGKYMIKERPIIQPNPFNTKQIIKNNYKEAQKEYKYRTQEGQLRLQFE